MPTAVQEKHSLLCYRVGRLSSEQEVLMTLGGEGGAVVGVDCEGDWTTDAVVDH